jgi:hypothetical protein
MIRRTLVLLVLLALVPTTANAAVSRKKAIWGPTEVASESSFPTYRALGAGIYRMKLEWDKVAIFEPQEAKDPLDASYDWPDEVDTAIAEADDNGIDVALTVTGTPEWANGGKAPTVAPRRPQDVADFLTAAERRYPKVNVWVVWEDAPRTFSASRYARALDAAYAALKARNRRNLVVGGNSTGNGAARWSRGLELANGKRARMDLYGHELTPGRALTARAVDALSEAAEGKRLFLDLALPSGSNQAPRLRAALRVAKRESSVYTLGYRGLYDELPATTGLLDDDGTKRPAYNVFRRG